MLARQGSTISEFASHVPPTPIQLSRTDVWDFDRPDPELVQRHIYLLVLARFFGASSTLSRRQGELLRLVMDLSIRRVEFVVLRLDEPVVLRLWPADWPLVPGCIGDVAELTANWLQPPCWEMSV